MKKYLTERLKQAIINKDEFSASILLTRLENLGYKVEFEYFEEFPIIIPSSISFS